VIPAKHFFPYVRLIYITAVTEGYRIFFHGFRFRVVVNQDFGPDLFFKPDP
jgi:hypothetical protein